MNIENEADEIGIPAKCFVCENGGEVKVDLDSSVIDVKVDEKDPTSINILQKIKLKCFVCGEKEKIGFEFIQGSYTVNLSELEEL